MRTSIKLPISVRSRMPVVCPPERQGAGAAVRLAGYVSRALVLWCAVFGLTWFFCDAFLLTLEHEGPLSPGWLALAALGAVAVFACMSLSHIGFWLGTLGLAGGAVYAAVAFPLSFWRNHAAMAANACIARLVQLGYDGQLISVADGAASLDTAAHLAAAALILLLAAAFVPSLIRRTHVYLPITFAALVFVPVFTYNISRSNWGLAFTLAGFTGILVLAAYDRRYLRANRDCDSAAHLFPDPPDRPTVLPRPAHLDEKVRQRAENLKERSVDEEIAHYLGAPAPKKKKLTPAERAERRRATRAYYASRRALRRWRRKQRSARIAAGGFAGLGATALALLILLIPAAVTEKSFTTVGFIDEPMQLIRRYVTAYLMGDNPILDEMGYGGNASNFAPHSTDASPRVFTGESILSLETMYNTNLYLRGWVATDYRDGSWYSVDARGNDLVFQNYRSLFGTAFSPELLRTNFYSIVDPSVTTYTDYIKRYQNHSERGFVTMQVNLRRVGGNSNLVYLPSYYNPKIGVLGYTSDQPTEYSYINYFDGLYTGRRFLPGASYAAVSYATTMRDETFIEKVGVDIAAYNLANAVFTALRDAPMPPLDQAYVFNFSEVVHEASAVSVQSPLEVKVTIGNRETGYAVTVDPLPRLLEGDLYGDYDEVRIARTLDLAGQILSRFFNYSQAELADLDYATRVEDYYRSFVYTTYRGKADSPIITEIARSLGGTDLFYARVDASINTAEKNYNPQAYVHRHNVVMTVMNYLGAVTETDQVDEEGNTVYIPNFTYTLTPTAQPDPNLDGVENFLTVTKEGYCVQFASAAALILREMGIPARYVEGYIATDFHRNLAASSAQRYSATVRDYHAHAWVEVWYDGIGWLNYEATPVYMADMYEEQKSTASNSYTRPWESTPEEEETPIDLEELARLEAEAAAEAARQRRIMITCIVLGVLLVVAILVAIVAIIVNRARRADARRDALYAAARTDAPTRETARTLIDEATALLAAYGAAPKLGEQRSEYAERLTEDYAALAPLPLDALFDAIAAEEFGHGMEPDSVAALAAFRAALGETAKARIRAPHRAYLRYVKHLL